MSGHPDLHQALYLTETNRVWRDHVTSAIEIDPSLQRVTVDRYVLRSQVLRDIADGEFLYLPISFNGDVDPSEYEANISTRFGREEITPVAGETVGECLRQTSGLSPSQEQRLRQNLLLPIWRTDLSDDFPVLEVRHRSRAQVRPARPRIAVPRLEMVYPVTRQRVSVGSATTDRRLALTTTEGLSIVTVVVDLAQAWTNGEVRREVEASIDLAREVVATERRTPGAMTKGAWQLAGGLDHLAHRIGSVDGWVADDRVVPLGWQAADVEELRGRVARLAGEVRQPVDDLQRLKRFITRVEKILDEIDEWVLYAEVARGDGQADIELPPGVGALDLTFAVDGHSGSGRPWTFGSTVALGAIALVCLGVLLASLMATDLAAWAKDRSEAVVALLVLVPGLAAAQVERADAGDSVVATYARRTFVWALLTPLVFPILAALLVIQQSPNRLLIVAALASGTVLAGCAGFFRWQVYGPDRLRAFALKRYRAG